jgi:succinate-acetate transporter protein
LHDPDDSNPYGILTTGEPAPGPKQQDETGGVEPTHVALEAVDKAGAHASGAPVPTSITITATPRQQSVGGDVTVSGQLTAGGELVAGAPVSLYVNGAGFWSKVSERATDVSGSYAFLVKQPTPETRAFKVAYAGSATHQPCMSDEVSVSYVTAPAAITAIASPSEQAVGQNVTIAGRLTAGGEPVAGAPITLFNTDNPAEQIRIAEITTDTSGSYQFKLTDTTPGHHTYVVYTPGTSLYAAAHSPGISVTYVVVSTAITATAVRAQQAAGESVTISGQLTAGGTPVPNANVSLHSAEDVDKNAPVATTSTDALGYFKLSPLAVTPETSLAYIVHYAGDAAHVPAQSSKICVRVATQPPEALQGEAAPAAVAPAAVAPAAAAPAPAAPAAAAPVQPQYVPHSARDDVSAMVKESRSIDITQVKNLDVTANPAALGLTAFGLTTVLLSLRNAGYYELNSMILAMGIFYGGLGQIIAGIMEWRKNNTFGTTAFLSFGLFWLTLAALLMLPKLGLADASSEHAMAAYFAMWGLFTFLMFVGSLKANRALQVVLGLLTILFFLLAAAEWTGSATVTGTITIAQIAGYEGILTGFASIYAGLAQVIDEMYRKTVAPLG